MKFKATSLASRIGMRTEVLALLASGLFTLLCNGTFWSALAEQVRVDNWILLLCTGLLITGLQWLLLLFVANRWTVKPILAFLAVIGGLAVYFTRTYGVLFDKGMLHSVFQTDIREATEVLDWKILPYLLIAGLFIWGMSRIELRAGDWKQASLTRSVAVLAAVGMIVIGLWPVAGTLVPTLREHKELRYLVTPSNIMISAFRVFFENVGGPPKSQARVIVAPDAKQVLQAGIQKPTALVLVVGETVRAANWGLNGYSRQTTPQLASRKVINFRDVTSCGTDTATSVPCMFSDLGRRSYDEAAINQRESLLHVLDRAGVQVLWRDNQSGCKGVCNGLATEDLSRVADPELCNSERCFDEVLIANLRERIAALPGDVLIVLHMLGNHGPAYYKRYPDAFRRWTPTCDTTDLASCSEAALVNTYDNAVLYTDNVLAEAIDLLARITTHDTALVYISDHGESLGETGLYLHGMPFALAPSEQTQVPMIFWLSASFQAANALDLNCLKTTAAQQPATQDNLFHTLLGLMNVRTTIYEPAMDLAEGCRKR